MTSMDLMLHRSLPLETVWYMKDKPQMFSVPLLLVSVFQHGSVLWAMHLLKETFTILCQVQMVTYKYVAKEQGKTTISYQFKQPFHHNILSLVLYALNSVQPNQTNQQTVLNYSLWKHAQLFRKHTHNFYLIAYLQILKKSNKLKMELQKLKISLRYSITFLGKLQFVLCQPLL